MPAASALEVLLSASPGLAPSDPTRRSKQNQRGSLVGLAVSGAGGLPSREQGGLAPPPFAHLKARHAQLLPRQPTMVALRTKSGTKVSW